MLQKRGRLKREDEEDEGGAQGEEGAVSFSAPHYMDFVQKTQVCNCLLCARLARVDPVPRRLCCLFIFFYLEKLFSSYEVDFHSPAMHLTHYICTSTPHKNTTH